MIATNFCHASGYKYYQAITVTSTTSVASGTNTNFPMLVSSTLTAWESSSTGGYIQNLCTAPNGGQEPCDFIFSNSSSCSPLSFETEQYVSSTGAVTDWVNVPSLAAGGTIYACYDNSAVTTDQSNPTSTWNTNYVGVWHLPSPTSTLNVNDSSQFGIAGTNQGATATSSGKIDGAGEYNGSSQYTLTNTVTSSITSSFTLDAWIYLGAIATEFPMSSRDNISGNPGNGIFMLQLGNQIAVGYANGTNYFFRENQSAIVNNWYQVIGTHTGGSENMTLYIDGSVPSTTTGNLGTPTDPASSTTGLVFGRDGSDTTPYYYQGGIDEVRVSNIALSPSWILTEYNNENSPSTFYAIGAQTTSTNPTSTAVTADVSCYAGITFRNGVTIQ